MLSPVQELVALVLFCAALLLLKSGLKTSTFYILLMVLTWMCSTFLAFCSWRLDSCCSTALENSQVTIWLSGSINDFWFDYAFGLSWLQLKVLICVHLTHERSYHIATATKSTKCQWNKRPLRPFVLALRTIYLRLSSMGSQFRLIFMGNGNKLMPLEQRRREENN